MQQRDFLNGFAGAAAAVTGAQARASGDPFVVAGPGQDNQSAVFSGPWAPPPLGGETRHGSLPLPRRSTPEGCTGRSLQLEARGLPAPVAVAKGPRNTTPAARRRAESSEHASVSPPGAVRELSESMPDPSRKSSRAVRQQRCQDDQRVDAHALRAGLHCCSLQIYTAPTWPAAPSGRPTPSSSSWQSTWAPAPRSVAIKWLDLSCLAGIYALWRRSRAHIAIAVALSTTAFVYVDIVLNNYSS